MKGKTAIFAAIFASVLLVLAACGGTSPFEGRWIQFAGAGTIGSTYEFRRGGEGVWSRNVRDGSIHEIAITWSVSDDRLEIFFADQAVPTIYYFEFMDETTVSLRRPEWLPESAMTYTRAD
ncbi:MAG: hypothetical protein FWC76_07215 [Defluviitaleaceae bacterium]|nr:hypothetical protein [Defluviitaleaceae bacterium]